ncbi:MULTISPECIES: MucB/RseB C-terminal domain-containing protein [Chromobacterium]|uniref:MucB/RseB C-terminal domain-containing protein n=3 Tax=Chromobacterium TaxID=535 RepID=A0ABS3GIP5_9NEIS|nr:MULTISPECIES: MucB/RseB C-terminal domain-containing protein [Chromobacterium]AXT46204.1 transcriptional regulator [Chromobacterium rhizoryzae]MBK0413337.1 MucB/RseB C-terminal domain-containing protein [Chromobacterium haemolyticum]MBO0414439.1 MucB/RseB C-terminal domain-containing protein [Chromobacterium haemolyticum]MBO0497702.1 MucB/RseB C-terminal domain-containing protein [Chromobacterium haemolyticum]MDH0340006.1 MucB/RseB C-terminal domain-containing protein [Chromobacterium haemo
MRVIPLISLMVVAAAPAAHAEDDWQLLRNVAAAGRQQALNGTYLHQMNGTLETFHIVREGQGDAMREKRTSLDGPSREIVRKGNELACFAPDKKALNAAKISAMRLFPALLPEDMSEINQSYSLKHVGSDRVAQRDCNLLELRPKDRQRYSLRMCVEPLTSLPLKMVTLSPKGEAVEQFTFTDIDLTGPKDKRAYRPKFAQKFLLRSGGASMPPAGAQVDNDVSGLPNGFHLLRSVQRSLPGQAGKSVRHMVYSDGLVMLSLFVETQPEGARLERSSNLHGAINMATGPQGSYQLTAVGDMPEPAMMGLLKGLKVSLKP